MRIYIWLFSSIRGPMCSWETLYFAYLTQGAYWNRFDYKESDRALVDSLTFSLSTPVENSEATWKKATKCNKLFYPFELRLLLHKSHLYFTYQCFFSECTWGLQCNNYGIWANRLRKIVYNARRSRSYRNNPKGYCACISGKVTIIITGVRLKDERALVSEWRCP